MVPFAGDWTDSPVARLVDILVDGRRRQYLLVATGYVTGVLGLALVFLPYDWISLGEAAIMTASIALMGTSFFCLFLGSITAPGG